MNYKYRTLSNTEKVMKIQRERDGAAAHDTKNYLRSVRNMRYYWAIDADRGLGQFPDRVVQELVRQKRSVAQFDITSPTVDFFVGALARTPMKVDYIPTAREANSLTEMLKEAYEIDRDVCDWPESIHDIYLNGMIYRSDAEIYPDFRYDKTHGNIGLRNRLMGSVLYSPFWKSRPSRDCRKCWVDWWMTPLDMLNNWDGAGEEISQAVYWHNKPKNIENLKRFAEYQAERGDEYGDNRGVFPYSQTEDVWGSMFRGTTEYRMEHVRRKRVYAVTLNGQITIPEKMKDPNKIIEWLNENFLDEWDPEGIFEEEEEVELQIATSICPQLDQSLILDESPTIVQCGRLQFIPFSANRLNGEFKGIVDSIADAQEMVNYLANMQMYNVQTTGLGGALAADPAAFASDMDYNDFVNNRNNPSKVFKLRRGALKGGDYPNGPAIPLVKGAMSAEAVNFLTQLIDQLWPKISRVTPASLGQQEGKNESGYLYRQKKDQSDIQQYVITQSVRLWWQEIAEAYMYQAAEQYGNQIERSMYNNKTGKMAIINQHRVNGDRIEIVNDFSKLKEMRHRVLAVEADDSPARQIETMMVAADAIKTIPPERQLMRMELSNLIVKNMSQFKEEDQERLDAISELETQVVIQNMKNSLLVGKRDEMALTNQVQQAQMGVPMPPPQTQGAKPGQSAPQK